MARVKDIAHASDGSYTLLSQTPKNYDTKNFFIKELQDKVNAEWPYRANRVDVEVETILGSEVFNPLEVIVQPVRNDKGTMISNDFRRLVFKNIREDRFNIGHKFRFSPNYNLKATLNEKNTWLTINFNEIKLTNTVVIQRCNGTLISAEKVNGITVYHEEPVIQAQDLSAVNFFYNETMVSPQSQLLVIAQHNEHTKQYKINQRFVVGYDKVYKVKAVNKFYANSTNNPENVGLIRIYMEITETSPNDNFEKRIAYNSEDTHNKEDDPIIGPTEESYGIAFEAPEVLPTELSSDGVIYHPVLRKSDGTNVPVTFEVAYELENLPADKANLISSYVDYTVSNEDNTFKFTKLKDYVNGDLIIKFIVPASDSPTHEDLVFVCKLAMFE